MDRWIDGSSNQSKCLTNISPSPILFVCGIIKFCFQSLGQPTGQFFKGDSYIVLQSVGSDPANLKHDVHIWIGSESTQDEYGTAAYKMVEADEYLEGAAVQHRQIEGREADDFVHCFDHLQYLKGGIQSGFRHVVPTVEKPFFFKFRRRAGKKGELVQVPMSVGSMDSKTSFLLYANKSTVWAWQGRDVRLSRRGSLIRFVLRFDCCTRRFCCCWRTTVPHESLFLANNRWIDWSDLLFFFLFVGSFLGPNTHPL